MSPTHNLTTWTLLGDRHEVLASLTCGKAGLTTPPCTFSLSFVDPAPYLVIAHIGVLDDSRIDSCLLRPSLSALARSRLRDLSSAYLSASIWDVLLVVATTASTVSLMLV